MALPAGVAGRLADDALLWPADSDGEPTSIRDVLGHIDRARHTTCVGRENDPPALAAQAKAIVDEHYTSALRIGSVAGRLGVSPASLTRTFADAYGLAPVRYRHQVRIVDALAQLAGGAVPIAVFQDVGFNDLSRFYKVFRRLACAPPGAYRPARSRNAKT